MVEVKESPVDFWGGLNIFSQSIGKLQLKCQFRMPNLEGRYQYSGRTHKQGKKTVLKNGFTGLMHRRYIEYDSTTRITTKKAETLYECPFFTLGRVSLYWL
jgi:hypothetical protein